MGHLISYLRTFFSSTTDFKTFAGLSSIGGQSSAGPPGRMAAASNAGPPHKSNGEYMGPVFIIRELDKDQELYDSFITTGGIQEVKPLGATFRGPSYAAAAGPPKAAAGKPEEDSEYFGVLVTSDTVGQIKFPPTLFLNVSMSTLLKVVSSRMPWLLVLRRNSHTDLQIGETSQQQKQQQQQQTSQQQQQAAPSPLTDSGFPGMRMEIPQRRRYYSPGDRQRRGADFRSFGRPLPDVDVSDSRVSERELLSTMCYNFARELGHPQRLLPFMADSSVFQDAGYREPVHLDVDAYTAAALRYESSSPPPPPQQQVQQQQQSNDETSVQMVVPKRIPS